MRCTITSRFDSLKLPTLSGSILAVDASEALKLFQLVVCGDVFFLINKTLFYGTVECSLIFRLMDWSYVKYG